MVTTKKRGRGRPILRGTKAVHFIQVRMTVHEADVLERQAKKLGHENANALAQHIVLTWLDGVRAAYPFEGRNMDYLMEVRIAFRITLSEFKSLNRRARPLGFSSHNQLAKAILLHYIEEHRSGK